MITDVFERKLPFCDVAQGKIGKSLILQKGIPLYGNSIMHLLCSQVSQIHRSRINFLFAYLESHKLNQQHRNSIFLFMGIPHIMSSQGELLGNPH